MKKLKINLPKTLNTITTKLLMLFLFMTIIPLIVLAQFSTQLINSNMTERAKSQLELDVKICQSRYNESLKNLKSLMVQGMSTSIEEAYQEFKTNNNHNLLSKNLENITHKSDINYLFIIDKNKQLIASANTKRHGQKLNSFNNLIDKVIFTGESNASSGVFKANELAEDGGRLYRMARIVDPKSEKATITGLSQIVAMPLFDENQNVEAVALSGKLLIKDYEIPDSIGNLTGATIMIYEVLEDGSAIVISTNLLAQKGQRAIGKTLPAELVNNVFSLNVSQVREYQEREYQLANYYPILNADGNTVGLVYLGIPEKLFTNLAEQNVLLVGVISIIGLFSAIILSAIFSRSITTPILKLSDAANKISLGDLSIRVKVKGSDEISQMGEAFNLMAQNLQREERLRDDFVATLTHDLKVPLLAKNQTLNYLIKGSYGEINTEQTEVLQVIKTTNEETLDMVNTLLEVYRYDSGKITLLKSEVDLRELIKSCINPLNSLITEKGLEFSINVPENRVIVSVDEREIKRVIHNLIANAISSTMNKGTIRVIVSLFEFKEKYDPSEKESRYTTLKDPVNIKERVLVSVYDTGIGMEKEDMENLFKRFSGNKGRKPSSTGLGLYYSHQVITLHEGDIWAESSEGDGSVFKFTLPLLKK